MESFLLSVSFLNTSSKDLLKLVMEKMRWGSPNQTLREGAGLVSEEAQQAGREDGALPWWPPASLGTGHYLVETVLLSLDSGVGERTAIHSSISKHKAKINDCLQHLRWKGLTSNRCLHASFLLGNPCKPLRRQHFIAKQVKTRPSCLC